MCAQYFIFRSYTSHICEACIMHTIYESTIYGGKNNPYMNQPYICIYETSIHTIYIYIYDELIESYMNQSSAHPAIYESIFRSSSHSLSGWSRCVAPSASAGTSKYRCVARSASAGTVLCVAWWWGYRSRSSKPAPREIGSGQ